MIHCVRKVALRIGYVNECLLSLYSDSTPEMFYWMRSKLLGPGKKGSQLTVKRAVEEGVEEVIEPVVAGGLLGLHGADFRHASGEFLSSEFYRIHFRSSSNASTANMNRTISLIFARLGPFRLVPYRES